METINKCARCNKLQDDNGEYNALVYAELRAWDNYLLGEQLLCGQCFSDTEDDMSLIGCDEECGRCHRKCKDLCDEWLHFVDASDENAEEILCRTCLDEVYGEEGSDEHSAGVHCCYPEECGDCNCH